MMRQGAVVRIVYRDDPAYFFEIRESMYNDGWIMHQAPSRLFSNKEERAIDIFDEYAPELREWLARLLEEVTLDTAKTSSFIDLMRSNLEKAAQSVPYPDQPFNDVEAAAWNKKLDDVMAKFEEMEKKHEIQQTELVKLRSEINEIRKIIRKVPKKAWIRSVGNRVLSMAEQALMRAGTEVAQEKIRQLISMMADSD